MPDDTSDDNNDEFSLDTKLQAFTRDHQVEAAIALYEQEANLTLKYDTVRANTLKLVIVATGAIVAFALSQPHNDIRLILGISLLLIAIASGLFTYSCSVTREFHRVNCSNLRKHLMQRALNKTRAKKIEDQQVISWFLESGFYSTMMIILSVMVPMFGCIICFYLVDFS